MHSCIQSLRKQTPLYYLSNLGFRCHIPCPTLRATYWVVFSSIFLPFVHSLALWSNFYILKTFKFHNSGHPTHSCSTNLPVIIASFMIKRSLMSVEQSLLECQLVPCFDNSHVYGCLDPLVLFVYFLFFCSINQTYTLHL